MSAEVEGGICPICNEMCEVLPGMQCVRLTCRSCDIMYAHQDCHMKRLRAMVTLGTQAYQADKGAFIGNFNCPRCPCKIRHISWIQGKHNEERKQKRVQAALLAAEAMARKPVPKAKKTPGAAPAVVPKPPKPKAAALQAVQQQLLVPGQNVAARLGSGAPVAYQAETIPGMEFVETRKPKRTGGKAKAARTQAGGSDDDLASAPHHGDKPAKPAGDSSWGNNGHKPATAPSARTAGGFEVLAYQALQDHRQREGGIQDAEQYRALLLSMGVTMSDDEDDDDDEDEEAGDAGLGLLNQRVVDGSDDEAAWATVGAKGAAGVAATALGRAAGAPTPPGNHYAHPLNIPALLELGPPAPVRASPVTPAAPASEDEDDVMRAVMAASLAESQQLTVAGLPATQLMQPAPVPAPAVTRSLPAWKSVVALSVDFRLVTLVEEWFTAARQSTDEDGVAWFRTGTNWMAVLPETGDVVEVPGLPKFLLDLYTAAQARPAPATPAVAPAPPHAAAGLPSLPQPAAPAASAAALMATMPAFVQPPAPRTTLLPPAPAAAAQVWGAAAAPGSLPLATPADLWGKMGPAATHHAALMPAMLPQQQPQCVMHIPEKGALRAAEEEDVAEYMSLLMV